MEKMHSEELHNLSHIIVGNSEGKRLLGRHRNRWEDNNKTDLK
jgi:hypothetical protein